MPFVIGLGHYSRTGKDTFGKHLVTAGTARGLRVRVVSFAYELKRICHILYGWAGIREPEFYETPIGALERDKVNKHIGMTVVQLWVEVGNKLREIDSDIWLNLVLEQQPDCDILVVPDVRYPNEADRLKNDYHATLIKIVRPGYGPKDTVADRALIGYDDWDYVIGGSGDLHDSERFARLVVGWLKGVSGPPIQTADQRKENLAVEDLSAFLEDDDAIVFDELEAGTGAQEKS